MTAPGKAMGMLPFEPAAIGMANGDFKLNELAVEA